MKPNILLIGCGYWGKNWLHTIQHSEYSLFGVVDPHPAVTLDHSISQWSDFNEIPNKYEFTHAIIATPAQVQLEIYNRVSSYIDDDHILVEKPVGKNSSEAFYMKNVFPGYIFLYDEAFDKMHDKINNDLGYPYQWHAIRASMGPRIRTDVSVLEDYMIHDLYLFLTYFDLCLSDITVDSATVYQIFGTPIKISDMGVTLETRFGQNAHFFSSWNYPEKVRQTIVQCTHGAMKYEGNKLTLYQNHYKENPEKYDKWGNYNYKLITAYDPIEIEYTSQTLSNELEHFIQNKKNHYSEYNENNLILNVWGLIDLIQEQIK